jgi:hypothetical protein
LYACHFGKNEIYLDFSMSERKSKSDPASPSLSQRIVDMLLKSCVHGASTRFQLFQFNGSYHKTHLAQLSALFHQLLKKKNNMTEQQDPTIVEGAPAAESTENPVKPTEEESPAEEATHAESEEGSSAEEKQVEDKETGFDFATMTSCCNFGATKGICVICQQSVLLSDATVSMKEEAEEDEKIAHVGCYQNAELAKDHKATKIQATFRGKKARDTIQKQAELEAAEKEIAEKAAVPTAALKKASQPKKSFVQKLFGGCMSSNAAVEQK